MLEFLQTGKALYVLAAVCGLGILVKWLTRSLYKRLIKETDNMAMTRNKNLRVFKQKAETAYQLNQGIPKAKPYVERQMYDFKFLRISLNGWTMFSNQMTLLCFLAGGGAAFASYWYRADPYFIVLYGSVGILAGLFTILVDHGAGIGEKKQQLFVALDNYMENNLLYHLDQEKKRGAAGTLRIREEGRDNIRPIHNIEAAAGFDDKEEDIKPASKRQTTRAERMKNQLKSEVQPRARRENAASVRDLGSKDSDGAGDSLRETSADGSFKSRRDGDYLKRSLEQIAASRDRGRSGRSGEDLLKDLTPEELSVIGEILKEYLT